MILTALLLSSIPSSAHAGWISWFSRYNNNRLKIPFHFFFFSNALLSRDRLCSHSHQFPSICSLPTSCFPGCSPFPMAAGAAVWPALLPWEGKWQTNTRAGQECFLGSLCGPHTCQASRVLPPQTRLPQLCLCHKLED